MIEKAGGFIRDYWPVLIGVLAVAVAWGTFTTQLSSIGESQRTGQATIVITQAAIATKLDRIAEDLAATKATGNAALRDIDDLRGRVRVIEARR